MALVKLGPVTGGIANFVGTGEFAPKKKPLYVRGRKLRKIVGGKPIESAPLNSGELDELDALRGLRCALHSDV